MRRYGPRRKILNISSSERLGNQAGIATTISQLGFLATERGELEKAIGLHGRALAIRARMGIPEVQINRGKLLELRPRVDDAAFTRALAAAVGEDTASEIVRALDGIEDAGAGDA